MSVDPRVQADFDALVGHAFKPHRAEAYIGDTDQQITVVFDPPVAFRLCGDTVAMCLLDKFMLPEGAKPVGLLDRTNDDWIDPIYDVEPLDKNDPQVAKYRSFYCFGRSYNIATGEVQESDIASIRRADGSWAMYV